MSKITVIGSFVMDNVAKMVKFPQAGETILGESLELFPGGKGINQCVSVARLGGDVEMVGMLGKDGNGDVFRRIMKEDGIKADNVFLCDKPTQNPAYAKQTLVLRKDTRSFFEYIGAKRVRKPVIRTKT